MLKIHAVNATLVATIIFIVFLPALQNEFVGDDFGYVVKNTFIRSIDLNFFRSAFLSFQFSNWHPLTWISHAMDYAVWELNPLGHHLTNNILHAANTFLVVLLMVRLVEAGKQASLQAATLTISHDSSASTDLPGAGDSRFTLIAAATAGFFFGLHPLRVEAVAWIAERKELLCALFFLLSIMMYVKYAADTAHSAKGIGQGARQIGTLHFALCAVRYRPLLFSLFFFILALMSKPMAVSLPVVLLILDWFPFKRIHSLKTFWNALMEKIPFIALSLIASIVTILAQKAGASIISLAAIPSSARLLVGAKSLFDYLWRMVLPLNLMPAGYPYPNPRDVAILSSEYLLSIFLLIGITVTCAVFAKKQKLWLSVWFYYVITLIPVLGIVKAGGMATADRYSYLPSLGPSLIVGLLTAGIQERVMAMKRRSLIFKIGAVTAGIVILIFLSLITIKQIGLWKNDAAIMDYLNRIRQEEVMERFQKAKGHYNLGTGFEKEGVLDKAIKEYLSALALYPYYPEAHFGLGNVYLKAGSTDKSIEHFQALVALRPDEAFSHNALGFAYAQRGFTDRAIEHFTAAVRLEPSNPNYQENLRRTSAMKNRLM